MYGGSEEIMLDLGIRQVVLCSNIFILSNRVETRLLSPGDEELPQERQAVSWQA